LPNLRERRRRRTADSIRTAAVALVHAKGLDNVTAEMISDAAGISPRTFFNYFSYKEEALFPASPEFPPEAIEAFIAGRGRLVDDLAELILPLPEFFDTDPAMLKKLFESADAHPKLVILKIAAFTELETRLAAMIGARLGVKAADDRPVLMAAMIATAIRVGVGRWVEGGVGSAEDHLRRTLRDVQTVFQG